MQSTTGQLAKEMANQHTWANVISLQQKGKTAITG